MSLSDQTKEQLQLLVDLNEPEALLATMARLARRVADGLVIGPMTPGELQRWAIVADALIKAEADIAAYETPRKPPAAENDAREAVAAWMIAHSYATGHGDTLDDLMRELIAQAIERNDKKPPERTPLMPPSEPA
jgi:hypothetical protein